MANKILNYVSIAVFLSIVIIILVYRVNNSCEDNKDTSNSKSLKSSNSSNSSNSKEENYFLDKYVYQNLPPNNYEYLLNYPNGPHSWGEWSWGSNKSKCKGDCNYSILNEKNPNPNLERSINL